MQTLLRALVAMVVLLTLLPEAAMGQGARERLAERTWTVGGLERTALVAQPVASKVPAAGAPLVFVFHGHGGNPRNVARGFAIHELWPEAIVVYPAGLPTPGRLTDPEGKKPGWQPGLGAEGDRDLAFFDAMFASLTAGAADAPKVDRTRVYATGHSNGGQFTYLLWEARHDLLAAVAPSAAGTRAARMLKPLPALHLAGEKDTIVLFANQQRVMEAIREVNGCAKEGVAWTPATGGAAASKASRHALRYESPTGTPVVTYIHPGGHEFVSESARLIVAFFREHAKATAAAPIRAYYIGHSLASDIPDMVAQLGDGSPRFSFREQFIPGAPLRWQYDELTRDPEKRTKPEPQFRGVWYEDFPKGGYTALVLVDSVPRAPKDMGETRTYAGKLIAEFAKSNAGATVYLYEPWSCIRTGTPEGCAYDTESPTRTLRWLERLEADRAMWDTLVKELRADHPGVTIELIPAGRAFIALAKEIAAGKVDGFARWEELFDDDIHANPYGKYFVACVHYAMLTGRSPEGSARMIKDRWGGSYWDTPNWQQKQWSPPSAKAVAALQRIAWDAVKAHRSGR